MVWYRGMRPLIGYNYGAGESKREKRDFSVSIVPDRTVMVIGTILCMAVPQALIGLFTGNPETIRLGGGGTQAHQYRDLSCHRFPSRYPALWRGLKGSER